MSLSLPSPSLPGASSSPVSLRGPSWPEEPAPVCRDWRDTLRLATDLAVLGFAVAAAALPLVTAGAAVLTGSAAIRHHLDHDKWPPVPALARTFRRALLPGLAGSVALSLLAALIAIDITAVRAGAAPGGVPVAAALLTVAVGAAGFAGLLVATSSLATAVALARRPSRLAAASGVVVLAGVLAVLVHPALTPVLLGYTLFALHVVARRSRTA